MTKYELMRSLNKSLDSPVETKITGSIPNWVQGTLFRNGPGRYEYGDKVYEHWFDGQAVVHKFEIKDGKVLYFNKLLETKCLKKSIEDNKLYPVFGTADVTSTLFGRLKTLFNQEPNVASDNTNVNIVPFAKKQLYALTETNYLMRIDPTNLNITKRLSVTKCISTSKTIVAHPHVLEDGSWIDMGMNSSVPGYEFVHYDGRALKDPDLDNILENGKVINCIPSSRSLALSYFHSFGLTENYIIFLEQALSFNFLSYATNIVLNKPFSESLHMDPKWNTRIHLINRKTGQIVEQKYHTDPMFVFHHINAYERLVNEKTELIIDVCAYDANHFDIRKLRFEDIFTERMEGKECTKSLAKRITLQLDLSSVSAESVYCNIKDLNSKLPMELPAINYSNVNTRDYKYAYGANIHKKPFSIVKINVNDSEESWEFKYDRDGREYLPTEPVFVENPNPQSEDDGVLLVMCLAEQNDYLSILDAKDLTEIARAELPSDSVPEARGTFTFHGFFADSQNYKALNQ